MTWLLIEAALALLLLLGIVWWTMFSGRHKKPDRPQDSPAAPRPDRDPPGPRDPDTR